MSAISATFRSLSVPNYRIWFAGALVSNTGTWMQRTAQDWIVLTQLSNDSAIAMGVVMALQFGPQVLLLPVTGLAADRFDRRKLLMTTQAAQGLLALGLGLLTLAGIVQLWHVYLFALLLGVASAFDAPARQTFVGDLVGADLLGNAVALNSASFNSARLIGPAVSGILMAIVGAGWVFVINAVTFMAVLFSLSQMKVELLRRQGEPAGRRPDDSSAETGGLIGGFRYLASRRDLVAIMTMIFLVGTFGLNFPIFTATMANTVFHKGAGEYGLLTSMMAVGSLAGALLSAQRDKPRRQLLIIAGAAFGLGCLVAALSPGYIFYGVMLAFVGAATQTFTTTANGIVQMTSDPAVRGRVMAIYMAIFQGGTVIGAPIVGWVADAFGPRWAVGVGSAAGFAAAGLGLAYLLQGRHRTDSHPAECAPGQVSRCSPRAAEPAHR